MPIAPLRARTSKPALPAATVSSSTPPPLRMPSLNVLLAAAPSNTRSSLITTAKHDRTAGQGVRHKPLAAGQEEHTDATSDSGSSTQDSTRRTGKRARDATSVEAQRPRMPYYIAQKAAKSELQEECLVLTTKLAQIRQRRGLPSRDATQSLEAARQKNQTMKEALRSHHLSLAKMESFVASRAMIASTRNPLTTFIALGPHPSARRQHLLSLSRDILPFCRQFAEERFRYIGDKSTSDNTSRFVDIEGSYHLHEFQVLHFHGAQSVKQVLDALQTSMYFHDMVISDTLGDVVMREEVDSLEEFDQTELRILHPRMISTSTSTQGIEQEMNVVIFSEYHPAGREPGNTPEHATMVVDFVDADEMHAYSPNRVRRDFTGVLTVSSFRRKRGSRAATTATSSSSATGGGESNDGDMQDELVVVVKRCAFTTIHSPSFSVPTEVMDSIRRKSDAWGDLLCKGVRDQLDQTRPPVGEGAV